MNSGSGRSSSRPIRQRPGAFALGHFFGIPVYVDLSWLVIFALITMTISAQFAEDHPEWASNERWFAGLVTSAVFFLCVLLHEIGHSLVARFFGIPVNSITLFIFGGVAQIQREPEKPLHEFLIAVAGPLTSLMLSVLFFALAGAEAIESLQASAAEDAAGNLPMFNAICLWLTTINLMLAIFNLIPGFPLDGGRVLRSLIWALSGKFEMATRVAAGFGFFVAYFFIALGIYIAFFENMLVNGLWTAFIGWFLLMAARSSVVQLASRRALAGHRVLDILEPIPYRVSPAMSVQALVDGPILQHGHTLFVVEDDGVLKGIVSLSDVKTTPREEWPVTPLQRIMTPAAELVVVEPHESLQTVKETMEERGLAQMPVVEGDRVLGLVTRDGLLRVLHNEMEFGGR
ncbi:MAG: site-2 protease family protein [Candidatus Sumerlaeia bacterium]|nr:site-2 protease family protein [Candidatus Sumerlaeia bacterium]